MWRVVVWSLVVAPIISGCAPRIREVPWEEIPAVALGEPASLTEALKESERVSGSDELVLLRRILSTNPDAESFDRLLREYFVAEKIGSDEPVKFTGYYVPRFEARRVKTEQFRYPLYKAPARFKEWPLPHPTRVEIEGADGLGGGLALEPLAYLSNRLDLLLVQVQGSAQLSLEDGKVVTVGVGAATNYPYVGLGAELRRAGKISKITVDTIRQYCTAEPESCNEFISRNNRVIFFKEVAVPRGSTGARVIAERSVAADNSLYTPGSPVIVLTRFPGESGEVARLMFDHDTGSAIKGPKRIDIFFGYGEEAGRKAGVMDAKGELYILRKK